MADKMTEKKSEISEQTLGSRTETKHEDNTPRKLTQYIAGLSAMIGAVAGGLVIGWSSPAGDNGSNLDYSFEIDANDFSWLSSMFNLGAAAISIPIGMLTDLLGRRKAMLILVLPFTIGWVCVIWPNSSATLIFGRFLLGVSGGAFCVTVPIYAAEIADKQTRGRLGLFFELLQCTGILIAYTLGLLENMFALSLISATVPLIFFAIFIFMPETPTYHLMKGNVDAARDTLIWLRGPQYDVEPELEEQRNSLAEAELHKVPFFIAIRSRAALKGLVISYGLMFFQQLSGINVIVFYGSSIFIAANGDDSTWPIIVVALMQVSAVFLSTLLFNIWGSRVILFISAAVMCLTTLVLGFYFYLDLKESSTIDVTWLPLVCLCGFVIAFEFGFGPIPWLMIGEIFSPRLRGIAGSGACFFNWMMAFVVTRFYIDVKNLIEDHGTFWIFSGICGLAIVFVGFFVPETKGKSLEQIQMELGGDSEINKKVGAKSDKFDHNNVTV